MGERRRAGRERTDGRGRGTRAGERRWARREKTNERGTRPTSDARRASEDSMRARGHGQADDDTAGERETQGE